MKANYYPSVECPKCPVIPWEGSPLCPQSPVMYVNSDGTIQCMNENCELFGVKFKRPSVELEIVEDGKE